MSEFDTDTALEPEADGRFRGNVTDRWMIGGGPNGGYIAGFLMRALQAVSPQPDALSITIHYAGRPIPGPCEVDVVPIEASKSHSFLRATLTQDGSVRAHAIAVFGRRRPGLIDILRETPAVGSPGDGARRDTSGAPSMFPMSFLDRFDYRDPTGTDMFSGSREGPARVGGWTRLVDRELDELAVPLFCDCWPPPMFRRHGPGMSPTIELTVHFRHAPEPGWQWCSFESKVLSGGYVEEDGEVWSESGVLVAQSRQLARFSLFE